MVAEGGLGGASAALGGALAAKLYGLDILVPHVEDHPGNMTRFVVAATPGAGRIPAPTGHDKTSLAFGVAHDRPGTLVSVLHEFSDRAISLTKIESRPSGDQLGVYIFLIDIEGHSEDPLVAQALAAVREQANFFKVLGSYPVWVEPTL